MDKINIDNLNDMEVLGLYDDIIAWTAHKCEGYGYYSMDYGGTYCAGFRSGVTLYRQIPAKTCWYLSSILCNHNCCERDDSTCRGTDGWHLKYIGYDECGD